MTPDDRRWGEDARQMTGRDWVLALLLPVALMVAAFAWDALR